MRKFVRKVAGGGALILLLCLALAFSLAACASEEPAPPVYSVTFDSNEGSEVATVSNIASGALVAKPTDPTRTSYDFAGWFSDEGLTEQWYFTQNAVTGNITLYAKWELNLDQYLVSFKSLGMLVHFEYVEQQLTVSEPTEPERSGYNFIGWYDSETLDNKAIFPLTVTENLTLFAGWEKDNSPQGSSLVLLKSDGNIIDAKTIPNGQKFDEPNDPKLPGFVFHGWYESDAFDKKAEFPKKISEDTTLHARWIKTYKFYVTLGTLPTLYAGLDVYSDPDFLESYIWYFRSGTFNPEYFPENVNVFSQIMGTNNANSTINYNIIKAKIVELDKKNPNSRFILYCDDLRARFVFDLLYSCDIDDDRFNVVLLSDGTGSYNTVFATGDTDAQWESYPAMWEQYVNEAKSGTQYVAGGNSGSQAMELQKYAPYASMFDNVEYWLQFPEYLRCGSALKTADIQNMNLIKQDPKDMYFSLSEEKREQFSKAVFSSSDKKPSYYDDLFLGRDKKILIVTGTNIATLAGNQIYIDKVIYDYGDDYYLFFKPHPSYPPNADFGKYLQDNNIVTLPNRTPMEAIIWMYPEVFIGGYNSSLFMSAEVGQTLFFFGNIGEPLVSMESFGHFDNVKYY